MVKYGIMINFTRLWCGRVSSGDRLRYEPAASQKPIMVFNATKNCNLKCRHCYADAQSQPSAGELSTLEIKRFIDDCARNEIPVLLFSGGEPLLRADLIELGAYAASLGIRTVLSSNGTLIDAKAATALKQAGFSYIGISLDGMEITNDRFRASPGAFQLALQGIRNSIATGLKTGLRFTLNKANLKELPEILELCLREHIPRFCLYHLVSTGRGSQLSTLALTPGETRMAIDSVISALTSLDRQGMEILTVDNHCDAAYLYRRITLTQPEKAAQVLQLLKINGGNSSGAGIACVDEQGRVYPDQFMRTHSLGNIREQSWKQLWEDKPHGLLSQLRKRKALLTGRCSSCNYLDICNGNLRARAEAITGNLWGSDPACYLTDGEIASSP